MAFTIREAAPSDIPALARLHVKTFEETHGGGPIIPSYEIRERQWREALEARDESRFTYVIEDGSGELVGFARGVPYDEPYPPGFAGELNKIYLLRAYHRQGLGRRLVGSVARRFLSRGIASMLLFGDANNPSNGFYEALGADKLCSEAGEFHGAYGWRDLRRLVEICPAG